MEPWKSRQKEAGIRTAEEMLDNLELEVGIMSSGMERIEAKLGTKCFTPWFDPRVSLILTGLQQENNEDFMAEVLDLLRDGLSCDPVPTPTAVDRIRTQGLKPSLIKGELQSAEEKVAVLQRKTNLKNIDGFQRVFVTS